MQYWGSPCIFPKTEDFRNFEDWRFEDRVFKICRSEDTIILQVFTPCLCGSRLKIGRQRIFNLNIRDMILCAGLGAPVLPAARIINMILIFSYFNSVLIDNLYRYFIYCLVEKDQMSISSRLIKNVITNKIEIQRALLKNKYQ